MSNNMFPDQRRIDNNRIVNENHEFLIVVAGPGGLVIVGSASNEKDAESKASSIARDNLKNNSQVMVFNRTAAFKAEINVVKVA